MDALIHINQLFAGAVYSTYQQKRYGLKNCAAVVDAKYAYLLRTLLLRRQEQTACNYPGSSCCSLSNVEEKITTL